MSQQPTEPTESQWPMEGDSAMPPAPSLAPMPTAPQEQDALYYPPTVPFSQPYPQYQQYQPWQPAPIYQAPQQSTTPARMPKHQAIAVTKKLKAALIAGSVMAFGVLTALAAGHITGATARASGNTGANPTNTNTNAGPNTAPTNPSNSTNAGSDGGFFNQGPSSGANGNSGGFGASPSAPSQAPVSGTTVS